MNLSSYVKNALTDLVVRLPLLRKLERNHKSTGLHLPFCAEEANLGPRC